MRILLKAAIIVCFFIGFTNFTQVFADEWRETLQSVRLHAAEEDAIYDPHDGSATWMQPSPSIQQSRDAKLRRLAMGGIFVPAMTLSIAEPKYRVLDGEGEQVEEAFMGTTVYVPSGSYVVEVGTGATEDRLVFDVQVEDGDVTFVPVEWSGLVVKVVNERGGTFRGNYELVRLPERAYVGLGTGALISEGEHINTWLLWPGKYMLISAGEGYQARKNFITVELKSGALSLVTLVMDEESGDIRGGGEIDVESEKEKTRWWNISLLVGGSTRFNSSRDVVGKASGELLDISAFVESTGTILRNKHYVYGRFNAEIGGTFRLNKRPFTTNIDELTLELLYAYRIVTWFGPYARFSFESNMAPAVQELDYNMTVERYKHDGTLIDSKEQQLDIKLSPTFSPIKLSTGAGARFDYGLGFWLQFSARLGIGYRKVFARDLFVVLGSDATSQTIRLGQVLDTQQFGIEAALNLDITPLHWLSFKIQANLLEPFTDWKAPYTDLRFSTAIRISSIASLSYMLRVVYEKQILNRAQIDQYVQLRFSYKIL
ncbi:MAG: hypothetical protein WC966_05300 [Bradymonadales bacterium]|jgi:hypothetical protein